MNKTIKIAFAGDLVFSHAYNHLPPEEKINIFSDIKYLTQDKDIAFANLETVLSDSKNTKKDKIILQGDPVYASAIQDLNITHLSLGNNHTYDLGETGLQDTQKSLSKSNIKRFGSGCNTDDANQPTEALINDKKICFLSFTCRSTHSAKYASKSSYGVSAMDKENMLTAIKAAKELYDTVIVSLHWGVEHCQFPTPAQRKLAQGLICSGADIIAGHHPHVLQGYEKYKKGVILYSLGSLTLCDISTQIIKDNKINNYTFTMQSKHRKSAIINCEIQNDRSININTDFIYIDKDLKPRPDKATQLRKMHLAFLCLPLKLPGYTAFYNFQYFLTYKARPALRVIFSKRIFKKIYKKLF